MGIFIKKYIGNHLKEIEELMKYSYEEQSIFHIIEQQKYEFAYVAYDVESLVGLFVSFKSKMHPYCYYFRLFSMPFVSQNVEQQLMQYVLQNEVLELPLQTSLWETSRKLMELYEQFDLKIIRKTYMPKLYVHQNFPPFPVHKSEYELRTLKDIVNNQFQMEQLLALVRRNYEETHLANPVADLSLKQWQQLFADAILEGSFLLCNASDQSIVAYSFLHEAENDKDLELGWCGVDQLEQLSLLQILISKQITYANTNGYEALIGEFDTTSKYALEILKAFPFEPCPTWITFQR
ncbi:GNAT family acetyltransferase [Viridibacillus sp. YIM B01967]|uniref:GNAT family acetyltransferase n=1 Tax=Viridibacillus soli TaxID=2798301 RepID=A0ABS1HAH0_9BACL|nr:GNAT family acetyltransferase [Viridibacillus soli]MBK3496432.1 GNAT family acetyltransferase [Viridibacillus soli]